MFLAIIMMSDGRPATSCSKKITIMDYALICLFIPIYSEEQAQEETVIVALRQSEEKV